MGIGPCKTSDKALRGEGKEEAMYCKHCGTKLNSGEKACPGCGKKTGGDGLKIALMAVAGVLVVAVMAGVVYIGTNGWPDFGSTEPTGGQVSATTPTDGNPGDVSCKGTYTVEDAALLAAKDTVVATMGDAKLTNGQLQVYYWMNVSDFLNYYGSYAAYFGLDSSKPLDQQLYDEKTGQSWQQYFLQAALDSWKREQALTLEAEKNGFQMGAEYQEYLDDLEKTLEESATTNKFDSVEAMLQAQMGAAADFASYKYYMDRYYKGNLYFEEAYQKLPVTVDELEAYFKENAEALEEEYGVTKESGVVAGLDYVMFYPEGATAETITTQSFDQAAWDAARAKAQAVLDSWVAGGAKPEDFAKLIADANTADNAMGADGGKAMNGLTPYFASEVDVRHVLIEIGEDTSEEGWEACRKQAQALLDSWVVGGATEEAFAAMAKEYTADGNGDEGGLYENVTKDYMVEEFDAWIYDASRKYGDYGLVKTRFGYHIMFFVHGDTEIDSWTFAEGRQKGEYALLKADYGYYIVRFTGSEEGWAYYSREAVQLDKMNESIETGYTMEVDYSAIALGTVKTSG